MCLTNFRIIPDGAKKTRKAWAVVRPRRAKNGSTYYVPCIADDKRQARIGRWLTARKVEWAHPGLMMVNGLTLGLDYPVCFHVYPTLKGAVSGLHNLVGGPMSCIVRAEVRNHVVSGFGIGWNDTEPASGWKERRILRGLTKKERAKYNLPERGARWDTS